MKLLVVDDNPQRYRLLIRELTAGGMDRSDIDIVTSAMEARERLASTKYDLMVVDIVLPLRPEDDPEERHSRDLLMEVLEFDTMIPPRQIVGLTASEVTAQQVAPFFMDHMWTIIAYSPDSDAWVQQLRNCLTYLQSETAAAPRRQYGSDIAIVCALSDPELKAVLRLPWNWQAARPLDDVTFVHDGWFQVAERRVTVVAAAPSRMGMVSTALLSSKLIETVRPRLIAMAGICAGVRGKANLGDILLADPSWDWQSGKRVRDKDNTSFAVAPHQISIDSAIRVRFEQMRNDRTLLSSIVGGWSDSTPGRLKIVIGPVASGSAVLADGEVVSQIKSQHRELCGVEMEAYGLYCAASLASYPRPRAFAVKSVCDFADPDKGDDYQKYAAYTSAEILRHFCENYYVELHD